MIKLRKKKNKNKFNQNVLTYMVYIRKEVKYAKKWGENYKWKI